jgi:hypothetical protein
VRRPCSRTSGASPFSDTGLRASRFARPSGGPTRSWRIWRSGRERLIEFPIGTVRLVGVNLPIGGGGYFRLLPGGLFEAGIRRVNTVERRPVMFYFHPWELDPGQPRPSMAWHRRFRHYVGQRRHEAKLARLLRRTSFGTAREVLERTTPELLEMGSRDRHGAPAGRHIPVTLNGRS